MAQSISLKHTPFLLPRLRLGRLSAGHCTTSLITSLARSVRLSIFKFPVPKFRQLLPLLLPVLSQNPFPAALLRTIKSWPNLCTYAGSVFGEVASRAEPKKKRQSQCSGHWLKPTRSRDTSRSMFGLEFVSLARATVLTAVGQKNPFASGFFLLCARSVLCGCKFLTSPRLVTQHPIIGHLRSLTVTHGNLR